MPFFYKIPLRLRWITPFILGALLIITSLEGSASGNTIAQEKAQTIERLQKQAVGGDMEAQFSLATAYDSGYGVELDHATAALWYEQAAKQGHQWARFNLAVLYEEGLGVPQDRARAQHWYQAAAHDGLADAQSNLGRMYADAPSPDYPQALFWFERASHAGHAEATFNLALMHLHGLGTPRDISRARALLSEIRNQYKPAEQLLSELDQNHQGQQP